MQKDLFLDKPYAEIKEVKNLRDPNDNEIRVYCNMFPDYFNFQIRTRGKLNPYGNGKERDLIATVGISIKEMEEILEYMKEERNS